MPCVCEEAVTGTMLSVGVLLVCALVSTVSAAGKMLDLHSFTQETALNVFTSRWANFGTSVPLKSHIILTPSVPDRWGAQFHKYPLLTDRFEVRFSLNLKKVSASGSAATPAQSFAFWYVKENVTVAVPESLAFAGADVGSILTQSGFHFSGYRGRFEGVGVVFSYLPRPAVSIVVNDGSRDFRSSDLPLADAGFFDFRKNPRVEMRVVFENGKVAVSMREGGSGRWSEIAASKTPGFSGGYIGLSGVVEQGERQADVVMIDDFTVENLDLKQKGEEQIFVSNTAAAANDEDKDANNLLGDFGEVAEQKALKILTRNIYRLISEAEEPRKASTSAVKALNSRLDAVDKAIEELKTELNALAGGDMDKQFSKMKEELLQISKATVSSQEAKKKIEKLSASRATSTGRGQGEPVAKASKLKEKLSGSGSYLLTLLGLAFLGVCVVGFMMWFKVGKWEKKHIL